jgi:hypothetical protein
VIILGFIPLQLKLIELATDLISWINNHGKVRKMFDAAQEQISIDQTGKPLVLTLSTCEHHFMDNTLCCIH